jgi:hypothetical protein
MGMNEMVEWRICPDYSNYLVSSDGKVCRVLRDKRHRCGDRGRILRPSTSEGYLHVILMMDGKRHSVGINRLVARAFLGEPPSPEHQAAHWDGNRKNNQVSNLRWATPTENTADKLRHRTLHVRSWNSKLNETDIERIRDQALCGVMQERIAEQFRVQSAHISKVVRKLKWRQHLVSHVSRPT